MPINGILISCVASALAVVAALLGDSRYSTGAAIVIGVNSVLLSPVLWFTIVPPGQLVVAAFVACLVGAPFGAMALTRCVPQYRFAIVLSIVWTLAAPAVVTESPSAARTMRALRPTLPATTTRIRPART